MNDELVVTAQALLREVRTLLRFARLSVLYLILAGDSLAAALAPQQRIYYAFIFLIGIVTLFISVYAEEAINKWNERTTTNSTLSSTFSTRMGRSSSRRTRKLRTTTSSMKTTE